MPNEIYLNICLRADEGGNITGESVERILKKLIDASEDEGLDLGGEIVDPSIPEADVKLEDACPMCDGYGTVEPEEDKPQTMPEEDWQELYGEKEEDNAPVAQLEEHLPPIRSASNEESDEEEK